MRAIREEDTACPIPTYLIQKEPMGTPERTREETLGRSLWGPMS